MTNQVSLIKEFKKVKSRDAGFYEIASKAGGDQRLDVTKLLCLSTKSNSETLKLSVRR